MHYLEIFIGMFRNENRKHFKLIEILWQQKNGTVELNFIYFGIKIESQ